MKKLLILVSAVMLTQVAFSQERVLPLEGNPALNNGAQTTRNISYKTSPVFPEAFPLVDDFFEAKPNKKFWTDSSVITGNRSAIFNALNNAGNAYNNGDGSFGATDELTTVALNMISIPERCYLAFDYATGATWQANDSLVLQAMNAAGNWDNIWRSVPIATARRAVYIDFPMGLLYQHATLKFRLVSYGQRSAANTQSFLVHRFVFALRPQLSYYENGFWNKTQTFRNDWSQMQGELRDGKDYGINWGRVIKLNAEDEAGNAFTNGFNDTIRSHAFNLSNLVPTDSVFFRMYYRAVKGGNNDSLLVQFKNNGGIWITQMAVSATQTSDWRIFTANVNRSRFNHASFEYRVISRGPSSDSVKWVVTGFSIGKKLLMPFVDDFSSTQNYPDASKWTDRLVFINNRFPIAPPSLNVATFDGLDASGVPYGIGRGYCDTLTSLPIKLDGLTLADSVYLSFYVQPTGLGMPPDLGDTLSLFARYSSVSPDSFNLLWRGAPTSFRADSFIQVRIALPQQYLHDEFQMRFINKGSRTGNLNHWHLDYIYLNKGRTANDAITDIAIQESPSPLIKKFGAMPYTHFKSVAANYTRDTQYFNVKNNSNQNYAIDYGREIFDQQFSRLDTFGSIIGVMPAGATRTASIKKNINIAGNFSTDSVVVWSRYYIRLGTSPDNIRSNDTLWQKTYFGNYYAYDDGSAEAGYAIENSTGKVALRYPFVKADSLYGVSIHFNRGKADVSGLAFNIVIWKTITETSEEVLLKIPATAVYYNARNGFYYVKFTTPIYIDSEVYIGWEQTQLFSLNVGLDLNYKIDDVYQPNPEMYYNVQGLWQPTALSGALMMRPIVGKWVDPPPVGVKELEKNSLDVTLYPNPNNGRLYLKGEHNAYDIFITDMAGREVFTAKYESSGVALPVTLNGMYLVRVKDSKNGAGTVQKLFIQQ